MLECVLWRESGRVYIYIGAVVAGRGILLLAAEMDEVVCHFNRARLND